MTKPLVGSTYRTECGNGRVTYRPDWSASYPWVTYVNGVAGQHYKDLAGAVTHFALRNMTLIDNHT
jgi:hypothetical protein